MASMLRLGVAFNKPRQFRHKGQILARGFAHYMCSRTALTSSSWQGDHMAQRRIPGKIQNCKISDDISNTKDWSLVYEGPISKAVKHVKIFSLTTAAASVVCSPIFVLFGKQSIPLAGKLAVAGLTYIVGISSTVLLHYVAKRYVQKLYFNKSDQLFQAETLSFFGRLRRTQFEVKDMVVPKEGGAFSTFEANGKKFFIHEDMVEAQQVLLFARRSQKDM